MWNVRIWSAVLACTLIPVAAATHAQGFRQAPPSDAPRPPPNYDAAAAYAPATAREGSAAPASNLLKPGTRVHRDERFGAPTFVWAAKGHPYAAAAKAGSRPREEGAARFHLRRFAAAYDMDAADADTVSVHSIHNTGKGPIIVKLKQSVDGIEIFRDEMSIAMDRNLDLISISGFLPGANGRAARAKLAAFALDPLQAIAAATKDLTGEAIAASSVRLAGSRGGYELYDLAPGSNLRAMEATRVKRVYFHLPDRLEAAYYVELNIGAASATESLHYGYVISAVKGVVLFRHNYTVADSYSYRVWADATGLRAPLDGPAGNTPTPHPTGLPDGFQPAFIAPSLVTLQNGPISTNDPWLLPGATQTIGNNVEAYADLVAPDGFSAGDFHASTTGANAFDRTYDTTLQPQSSQTQQMAAITQLFYNVNFFHDWYYDSGFNEAAGNAQTNNFGRGGLDNDSIKAEAQDFSGRNNANMSTPPDGARPRMQMFIFDGNDARQVIVNSPMGGGGPFAAGIADFGPQAFDFAGNLVLANPTTACTVLVNSASVSGNIALVDRGGGCSFSQKAAAVFVAGGTGMIVANNVAPGFLEMAQTIGFNDNVPSLMISLADGDTLKTDLGLGTVNVTLHRPQPLDRDGTIDNQIVAHEWGHYISNRLIGNANGLATNMAGGLGEGWGDFHAMLLTVKAEDAVVSSNANFNGVYALAGYTSGGLDPDGTPNQGWYFGIRRVPYSTDFTKNALTFKHISNGVPLPGGVPTAFGADGADNAEVHNTGEVWATMLWECYAGLLRDTLGASPRLTFDQARDRMKNYLVAAYKLTPVNPTLLEARNALLTAASGDPVDHQRFEHAFARRGAGVFAVAPDRNSTTNSPGLVEDFEEHSTTKLTAPDLVFVGQPVTFTAKVTDGATGSVQFSEGATVLATVPLVSGTASFMYTTQTQGAHLIQVLYLGDAQFLPSSDFLSLFFLPPPDFTVSASPSSQTVTAGQAATIFLTVAPINLTQTVTFGCGPLPDKAACNFSPPSVSLDGIHPVAVRLSITTTANTLAAGGPSAKAPRSPLAGLAGFGMLSLFSLGIVALRRPLRRSTAGLLFGLVLALAACSGGGGGSGGTGSPAPGPAPVPSGGTPPGTYSISIAATASASNHSAAVSVTVQ